MPDKPFFLSEWEILQANQPSKKPKKEASQKVYDCSGCGLDKVCKHPKILRAGRGRKKILLVGLCPDFVSDRQGIPFVGPSGALLRRMLNLVDINLDVDCVRTNVVSCYPGRDAKGHDKEPTKEQVLCCRSNLEKDIEEVKPKMIICFGTEAINAVLQTKSLEGFSTEMSHGKIFPYHKLNCWVGCSYHPNFFLYRKNKEDVPDDEIILGYDLANIISYLDDPLPQPLTSEGNLCITNVDEAVDSLRYFCDSEKPVAFDYETNLLSAYHPDATILSISITNEVESAIFIPVGFSDKTGKEIFNLEEQTRILLAMKDFLKSDAPKVVQNYYMEEIWGRQLLGQPMTNFIWDTMVTAHVLNCHPRTTGLEFQAFEMCGHEYKDIVDYTQMQSQPVENVCDLNCWDSRYTLKSYYRQKSLLSGNLEKFNNFFTFCLSVLANLKDRGIKIDLNELQKIESGIKSEIEKCQSTMFNSAGVKKYEETKEKKFNINSSTQIGDILYDYYKVEKTKQRTTASGKGATSEFILEEIQKETTNDEVKKFISSLFSYRKNIKVVERGAEYRRLIDSNGFVHPTFNLNIARSYRSSADGPNIQNVFKRDEEQKIFRKCIVPRPGNVFLEGDYKALEVCVIAMVSKDLELIRQIREGVDTHRKWAAKIFGKPENQITSQERYRGKNEFVFPRFYGAVANSIARSFPEVPKDRIVKVCEEFWTEFHFVKEWQLRTIHDYKKNGYVELVTGARRPGPLNINKLYNTPIQGPAYHLAQDALNRVELALPQTTPKLITRPVAEIHDAILFDTPLEEIEDVMKLAGEIMVAQRFEWQIPGLLGVSWDVGETSWYDIVKLDD